MARIAILTASDRGARGDRLDTSGDAIEAAVIGAGHSVTGRLVVADDASLIADALRGWCDRATADVVLTTGGTGLTPRDVTPEATRKVAERDVPAIPIALAIEGLKHTPFAALSRGIAVTRKHTLIVNLPGSPHAIADGMSVLLPLLDHVAELLAGPVEHEA
jgi:molybdenum cofactor synthesis domain-containing protein